MRHFRLGLLALLFVALVAPWSYPMQGQQRAVVSQHHQDNEGFVAGSLVATFYHQLSLWKSFFALHWLCRKEFLL